jgi:hypothetical protein
VADWMAGVRSQRECAELWSKDLEPSVSTSGEADQAAGSLS